MATLYPENQQYVPKGEQLSSKSILPGLMKKLQEDVRKATANKMQESISSDFIPQYGTEPNVDKPTLDRFRQGEFGFETGTSISPPSERYESLPSYGQYVPTDTRDINAPRWVSPSEQTKISNLPQGMGSYAIDPSQQGKLIKSERVLVTRDYNPGFKDKLLGGLSPMDFQVDHIIPLWAGGSDTISNLQNLDLPTHQVKTKVQAVPLTLLAGGKINLNQARMMALTWKDKDASQLPNVEDNGMYPVDFAEKMAKQWEEQASKPKPVSFKDVYKGIPKAMQEFGKGWLPTPVREFIKGGVSGFTAGIVPAPISEEAGVISKIAGTAGHIAGTIYGLGKFGKLLGVGKNAILARRGTALANEAMKAANLAIDVGRPISTFTKMRHSATLLSLWGQLGLTGRELTRQQEIEAKNHMTQFLSDVAFGSILGASGQTARGYAQVGLGTTALSLMEGNDIEDALKDGALMTALHTLGYKGRFNEINGITYKRSAATLNQYLGDVVPPVRKGQTTPNVLKLDIPAIEQMRQQMQTEYSNDPRIMNVPEIKGEYDAVDFLTRAALIKHGEIINNSIKKTDIPQEIIDAEIRRIGTAGVQLYNQTLPQEFRIQKQMQDMQSLAEQLKPQIPSEQLKQKGPSINEITQKIPLKFPEQIHIKPEGVVFPEGNIPITGYSSNIDPISKSNIENFDKARGPHVSDRIIFVNDPKTNAIMRLINFEATLKGEKSPITNPENTLRAYYIEETPTGRELKPVGYAATSERIGSREFNINKNYDEMIERIRNVIDKAESPEKLMEKLNKDKSQPKIDETMAQELFNQKQAIKDLEDTALLTAIKATTPLEKYDVNLNNSPIAEAMRQNGLTFLTGNINKLTKTESGEPFLVLSVKDQNWLESMALRDKKPSPVQETIKEITERKKAVEITDRMKEVKQFPQKETLVTKSGIKLEKQINPDDSFWLEQNKTKIGSKWAELANKGNKIEHLMLPKNEGYAGKIRVNGKEMTYNEAETLFKKKVPPAKTLSLPFQQPKAAIKPLSGTFIPPSVKSSLPEAKMTQKEADRALYKRLSAKMDEIVKKATEEGRLPEKPTEKNALNVLSKKMVELIKKYKTVGEKRFVPVNIAKEKESLMKEAMIVADDALSEAATKGGGFFEGEQKFSNQIRRSVRGAELMIRNNKLKLSSKEQKDLENEFKEKIDQKIKQETEVASREYEPNLDFEERVTQKEIPIKVIKPLLTKDQELAKTYGLKLKEDGFLFLDKNREPLFADTKRKGTPLSFFGSMLKKDLDVYNKLKTQRSEDFVKDLDNMAKTPGTYSLFAKTVKEALNEIIVTPQEPWLKKAMGESAGKSYTFNSLLNSNSNYMKNLFETINFQGHPISQSIKRIIAQVEGKSPEQIKKIDLQIIKAEEKARELREEQASDPFSGKIEGISKEELKDMSIKEQNQVEKMQDLTNFELRFPSLIYEDLTGKKPPKESVVADGIRFAKDFVSNYSPKIKSEREGGKIKKKFMGQTEWEKIRKRVLEPKKLQ